MQKKEESELSKINKKNVQIYIFFFYRDYELIAKLLKYIKQ